MAVVIPVVAYTVKAQANTSNDAVLLDAIYPIKDDSARALMTLAAMYGPTENKEGWTQMICTGMTEDGCAYFKNNQAADLWQSQSGNIGSSFSFIANVEMIAEDTQLWKVQLTIFTPGKQTTSDVFAVMKRGSGGRWFLDRVLSGPGIALP
jgi:hypothetical protein